MTSRIDLHRTLIAAIEGRQRLSFTYNGKPRLVEPQCYGKNAKGTQLLRAHQLRGGREREPLFDIDKIENLKVLDDSFAQPGPNFKRNDSAMILIYAQLDVPMAMGASTLTAGGDQQSTRAGGGTKILELTALLTPAEEGGFIALNPETGTTSQGETVEEAISNLREATALYLTEFPIADVFAGRRAVVTTFAVPVHA